VADGEVERQAAAEAAADADAADSLVHVLYPVWAPGTVKADKTVRVPRLKAPIV
jgi:hypothetical protein